MYLLFRQRLYRNSELLTIAHEERLDYLNDVFSMKQIKIWNNEKYFLSGFDKASQKWGSIYRQNLNIALLPRYLVETCILIGAVILIYFTFSSGINVSETIPKFSIFLFSAFKLLPALQALYYSSSQIRGNIYSLENILNILTSRYDQIESAKDTIFSDKQIDKVRLEDISFSYDGEEEFAIQNVSISLEKGSIIGVTGHSGAGKSTFLDILMGLQNQSSGSILVNENNAKIFDNSDWFKKISYAPPSTSLFKTDLEMNILFNATNSSIEEAFKVVNLDFLNFDSDLPKQFSQDDFSEGQLQRIGLARAIAKYDSDLIILDEPTSALDNVNKRAFIESLKKYKNDKCIVLVTHDLELLKMLTK